MRCVTPGPTMGSLHSHGRSAAPTMHIVLFIVGTLFGLFGFAAFVASLGAVQQAAAGTLMTIGAVFFSGGAVVDAVRTLRMEMRKENAAIYGELKKLSAEVAPKS